MLMMLARAKDPQLTTEGSEMLAMDLFFTVCPALFLCH